MNTFVNTLLDNFDYAFKLLSLNDIKTHST